MLGKIILPPEERKIIIKVDKFLSKSNRENYNVYIKTQLENILKKNIQINIEHVDSQQEPCIQAADYISGAIFHKFEFENENLFRIIQQKIKSIEILFRK